MLSLMIKEINEDSLNLNCYSDDSFQNQRLPNEICFGTVYSLHPEITDSS